MPLIIHHYDYIPDQLYLIPPIKLRASGTCPLN